MRSRWWLRMKLNTRYVPVTKINSFIRPIINIFHPRNDMRWERRFVYRIRVILWREDTFPCPEVFHWLVLTPMPIRELIGLRTRCECEELIPEAYPEYFHICPYRFFYFLDRHRISRWISWTIREKYTIEVEISCHKWKISWDSDNIDSEWQKMTDHIVFHSHIHDKKSFIFSILALRIISDNLTSTDFIRESTFIGIAEFECVSLSLEYDLPRDATMLSDMERQRSCIDPRYCRNLMIREKVSERRYRFVMIIRGTIFRDDKPSNMDFLWFIESQYPCGVAHMKIGNSVVPDERIGRYEDLSRIRRIRQCLGVTDHPCIEYDFSDRVSLISEALARKYFSCSKDETGTHTWILVPWIIEKNEKIQAFIPLIRSIGVVFFTREMGERRTKSFYDCRVNSLDRHHSVILCWTRNLSILEHVQGDELQKYSYHQVSFYMFFLRKPQNASMKRRNAMIPEMRNGSGLSIS